MNSYIISPENTVLSASTYNLLIYLEKQFDDIGFYRTIDGDILQEKANCNFTYTVSGKTVTIFNSVDHISFSALKDATFSINWGDNQITVIGIEETKTHVYTSSGQTEITLSLDSPWTEKIIKTINVGTSVTFPNPLGTLTIDIPYSDEVIDQDYITDSDGSCQDLDQNGIILSGFTQSRLKELIKYGETEVSEGLDSDGNGVYPGGITATYTVYTIDGILYTDFEDGLTFYSLDIGENPLELVCQLVAKQEALLGVVSDISIQSDVFVERGKISVFEHNLRLSEIESTGELSIYGNGYFRVKQTI